MVADSKAHPGEVAEEEWRERLAYAQRVRTGNDPRWKRLGDLSEMGVLSGLGWANWMAERAIKPTRVPPEFWALDAEGVAVVACPCKHETAVRSLAAPSRCESDEDPECACPRSFFFDGNHVYAFCSPQPDSSPAA